MSNLFVDNFQTKKNKEFIDKAIDFTQLFSIMTELLLQLELLNTDSDDINPNKFYFRRKSPQDVIETPQENSVIYNLASRDYQTLPVNSAGQIRQVKPMIHHSAYDLVSDQVIETQAYKFVNHIQLFCISTSDEKLDLIVSKLESVFIRYKNWFNKHYRVKIQYQGVTESISGQTIYHERSFCKIINLLAITEALYDVAHEPVKNIETETNIK